MNKTFSVRNILTDAWKLFVEHKKFYLEVVIVFGVIAVAADGLREEDSMRLVDIVLSIINMVATWYGSVVLMKASLAVASGKPITPDVYNLTVPAIVSLILASMLVALGIFVGTILLIVPGVIFSLRTGLTQYVILDEQTTSIPAIKRSVALTKGYSWSFLRLTICFVVLALLSMFPLFGLGFIVLVPVSTLAMSLVYHKLKVEQGVVSAE